MRKWMKERGLSRTKAEAGLPARPGCEVRVPLQLSEAQLECYRDVLARRFDVLADPKRPRHSAQRTSEMRSLCAELRKVGLSAPFLSSVIFRIENYFLTGTVSVSGPACLAKIPKKASFVECLV